MTLTLVLGPANAAKAGEVLGAFADAAPRGAMLVVPTASDAVYYARELAGPGALLGSVVTFSGLVREIARRTDHAAARLSQLQRDRVLRRVVAHHVPATLEHSARSAGFPQAAGELIAELERSLITPQRFTQALRAWAATDPRLAGYAEDLAALYAGYRRELDRLGRVDAELYGWGALDSLRAAPGRWGADSVFFYGFDDLTGLERDAIETLSRVAGADVTVSLTYEAGHDALSAQAELAAELRAIAERVLELPALPDYYDAPVLHHLERELFAGEPPEPADPGDAVVLLESGGERTEAELIAGQVLGLLGDGLAPGEIVLVSRRPSQAAPVLARVFSHYGIPLAADVPVPFISTALGRTVRALHRCALPQAGPGDLLEYLRAPGLLEQPGVADALELAAGQRGWRTAAQAQERLGFELREIEALRSSPDPLAELAAQAARLLALPHRGAAPVLGGAQALDAQALGVLARASQELADLGERPDLVAVGQLLDELQLPARGEEGDGAVLLADPLGIRARRYRAVIVCGLQEGEFPHPRAPEPFLSDDARRELAACSGLRLGLRENWLARERYLFYACVSRASERLVLSYRSSDEEGNLALASPFVSDVAELLDPAWRDGRRRRLLADVVWPVQEAPTERERARALAAGGAGDRAGAGPGPGAGPGSGDDRPVYQLTEAALSEVRHSRVVSGGALESFATCPVRWLVERELQPAALHPDPDPMIRGNFMHELIERVLSRLGGPVSESSLREALALLDQALEELPSPLAPGRGDAVRAAALREAAADLRRYLSHEARAACDWTPVGLELKFGIDSEDSDVVLPALDLGEGVALRGVIDRVDSDGQGHAIVRDYKSGRNRPEYPGARWVADAQLQVGLYMLAVRELLGLDPIAGLYQPLGGDDMRARGVFLAGAPVGDAVVAKDAREADELEQTLAEVRARAVELARELRSGRLEPCPEKCSRGGCAYPGICRA